MAATSSASFLPDCNPLLRNPHARRASAMRATIQYAYPNQGSSHAENFFVKSKAARMPYTHISSGPSASRTSTSPGLQGHRQRRDSLLTSSSSSFARPRRVPAAHRPLRRIRSLEQSIFQRGQSRTTGNIVKRRLRADLLRSSTRASLVLEAFQAVWPVKKALSYFNKSYIKDTTAHRKSYSWTESRKTASGRHH